MAYTVTVTVPTGKYVSCSFVEVSGGVGVALDTSNTGFGSSATGTGTGAQISPSNNGDFLYACMECDSGGITSRAKGTGWTSLINQNNSSESYPADEYLIQTTKAAIYPGFTWTGTEIYSLAAVAFSKTSGTFSLVSAQNVASSALSLVTATAVPASAPSASDLLIVAVQSNSTSITIGDGGTNTFIKGPQSGANSSGILTTIYYVLSASASGNPAGSLCSLGCGNA